MTALLIDTSTQHALLAISEGEKILASQIFLHRNQLSKNLYPSLQILLEESQVPLKQLHYIAVGTGPGSYTGTRVGVSAAKSLSFALGVPLLGFCSLLAFSPLEQGSFVIVIPAKKEEIYFVLTGYKNEKEFTYTLHPLLPFASLPPFIEEIDFIATSNPSVFPDKRHVSALSFNLPFLARLSHRKFQQKDYDPEGHLEISY